jgi:hypothetical protein
MQRTLKALNSSTKTSLRIDDEGLLSLQFLMPSPRARGALGPRVGGTEAFVEFRVRDCGSCGVDAERADKATPVFAIR